MSSSIVRPVLGLSASDSLLCSVAGAALVCTADGFVRSGRAQILESVDVKFTFSGKASSAGDDTAGASNSIDDGERNWMNGADGGSGGRRISECTESLGFESLNEKAAGADLTMEAAVPEGSVAGSEGSRGRTSGVVRDKRSEEEELKNFPPLLTTLNANGRPIFDLKKVNKDGRLVIRMLRNVRREIVRFVGSDGRLKMQLIEIDNSDEDEDDAEDESGGRRGGCGGAHS
ncbi:hypothetical protein Nepgr_027850 [Nepenthes gracilis]|uniref:FAF domain-containing protein n=1 Tax=Nepenthes gracilis TaxID=150966 RepID=A0AAD3Y1L4_NEPGR|nr:hypothetical protein Nepgr_027850 [Nepenthes gracilis]